MPSVEKPPTARCQASGKGANGLILDALADRDYKDATHINPKCFVCMYFFSTPHVFVVIGTHLLFWLFFRWLREVILFLFLDINLHSTVSPQC